MSESFTIHESLPSGFTWANQQQRDQYVDRGLVNGARKVCFVRDGDDAALAVVLGPPTRGSTLLRRRIIRNDAMAAGIMPHEVNAWYIKEYRAGWDRARNSTEFPSGKSAAYEDGYLDRAAGRAKWHLTHCVDHDNCGEA